MRTLCVLCAKSLQSCPTPSDPIIHQAPLSMGFSRQEHWSRVSCPPPGIEPTSLMSPTLAGGFSTGSSTSEAQ